MKLYRLILSITLMVAIIVGCKKTSSKGDGPGVTVSTEPDKATLVFPAENSACVTGTGSSSSVSTVVFTWDAPKNTDSYELTIKNLLTGVLSTQPAYTNELAISLVVNTPYSWYVVSKSKKTTHTKQSDTWKFYNSGPGVLSHPPFPADAVSPLSGVQVPAGAISLTWSAADADNDIKSSDLYFGTSNNPSLLSGGLTATTYNGVTIATGNTYYWKVIIKDSQGNTSDSGLFYFTVK